jgi:hypothetical protein
MDDTMQSSPSSRFDAPFWILLISGVLLIGALGCFGLAAAAKDVSPDGTSVMDGCDS